MTSILKDMGLIELITLPFALFIIGMLIVKLVLAFPRRRHKAPIAHRARGSARARHTGRNAPSRGFRSMKSSAQRIRERPHRAND